MPTPHARYRAPSLHDDSRLDWSPPSRKPNRFLNKHVLVIAAGVFCTLLLLIVILNIKTGPETSVAENQIAKVPEPVELIAPKKLGSEESKSTGFDYAHGTIDAPQGAWISITDPKTGRLVQQYRFDHIDPNPPGKGPEWIAMENPQVKLFMESNRVLVLTGKSAIAHAPQRALVSGSITGDVAIRVFEPEGSALPDTQTAAPTLTVNSDQASFDNFLGEVRCDGPVLINHPRAEIPAHDLRILINDTNNTIALNMAGADYIRLHGPPESAIPQTASPQSSPANSASPSSATASSSRSEPDRALAQKSPRNTTSEKPSESKETNPGSSPRPSKNQKPSADAPTFYHLVLHDNVRIVQNDSRAGKLLTGDTLSVIFSSKTKSLEDTTLASRARQNVSPLYSRPLSPLAAIAALSLAQYPVRTTPVFGQLTAQSSPAASPAPGETLITFTGPVTLEPLTDSSLQPPTPEDALFDLTGDPVTVHDYSGNADITCASARYTTADQRIDLLASAAHIVQLSSDNMRAEGQHAWLAQTSGFAGFIGAGWMGQVDSSAPPASQPAASHPAASQPVDPFVQLKITWTKGVDLAMDPAAAESQTRHLRKATFTGDVHVESPDLALDAETMHIGFRAAPNTGDAAGTSDSTSIESIIAEGSPESGKGVTADQRTRMLFADHLHVTLLPAKTNASQPGATATTKPAHGNSFKDKAADVQVNTLTAKGDVQILLDDGGRVFADDLFADAVKRTVKLTGTDIVIIRDALLIEKGTDIEIDDTQGSSHFIGGGQARLLREPLPVTQRERIAKPVVTDEQNPTEARVRWNEGADFDHRVNDNAGALTLRGGVDAVTHPSPLEVNTMTGDALTIHFQHNAPATPSATKPTETAPAVVATTSLAENKGSFQSALDAKSGPRVVARFVAQGNAKLENRLQQNEQDQQPRIVYIAGNSVDYNLLSREALIDGAGEMLIRDLHAAAPPPAPVKPQENVALADAPFSSRGTTHFEWKKQFQLKRTKIDEWTMAMEGDVQGRHLTPDSKVSTITGQHVGADLAAAEPVEGEKPQTAPAPSEIDLGSSMKITRLHCRDSVYIRTETRDVECDDFDYDIRNRFAVIAAYPGRTAAVTTKGTTSVNRAQRMEWNMLRDSVTIINASGSAPR